MDLHEALVTRRTIQRFRPGAVPQEPIDRALEVAVMAPNHKATWPFRFTLVGPETREHLFRIALRLKEAKKGPSPELEAQIRLEMLVPDRLVVVSQVVAADPGRAEEDYATCACATYALMLSLHADGLATKWGTGGSTRDPEALRVLGLAPHDRVVAFVWIGYPAITPQTPKRPPLQELVRAAP